MHDKSKWRSIILCLMMILSTGMILHAQTSEVSGRILDENNQPLAGVNIYIKGTTGQGSISNASGEYSIFAEPDAILVFSFVGYQTFETELTSGEINVSLEVGNIGLEEVVAIGYGSVRKKDLSSSITTVQGDEIARTARGNFAKGLQGMAAGVQVFNTDGRPGSTPTVLIRGATSITGNVNPIIVVDGIPVGFNANQLNPEDIESVSILKDASATAIYGTQAANGVMLVTTKKGKMGQSNFNVSANFGMQQLTVPAIAGAREYMQIQNLKRYNERPNQGEYQLFSEENIANAVTTDWWSEAMRPLSPQYKMDLGFDGGSKKFRYSANIGYFRQESQMDVGYWEKITARFNTEYHFSDNIKFGQNFYPRVESWQDTPDIWSMISMDPTTPVYLPEEEQEGKNRYSIYQRSYNNTTYNPMGMIERAKVTDENLLMGLQSNTYLNIRFLKDFVFNTQLGLNASSVMEDTYNPVYFIHNRESNQESSVSRTVDNFYSYVFNNTLNYLKTFNGEHHLNVLVGFVSEKGQIRDVYGYKKNIPNDNPNLRYLDAAENEPQAFGNDEIRTALLSGLARIMYNYRETYFLNFSFRRDGSFKFPENQRMANFPSVSVAWAAHNESFIQNVGWISTLKLRAGWGRVGNQKALSPNVYLWPLEQRAYVLGDQAETRIGALSEQYANEDIKWEVVEDLNAGIDMAFFQNSFTATIEVYNRTTHDMIMLKEYPFFSGYPNYESQVWSNIGSISSRGIELELGYYDYKGEFTWSVSGNITRFKTTTLELADGIPYLGAWWGDYLTRTVEGELVGQFWGYETGGLFQNWTDVYEHCVRDEAGNPLDNNGNIDGELVFDENGKPTNNRDLLQNSAVPGDVIFLDRNGNHEIEEEDQTFIGSGQPDFTAGMNIRAAYKGFDFSIDLYASVGADIFNATLWEWHWGADNSNTFSGIMEDSWHGEGTHNKIPILNLNDRNRNYWMISDLYMDNGTFMKIRNIQLGYTLPLKKGIKKLRIYTSVDNAFVYTRYRGFEPELYGSVTEQNIDWGGNYPNPTIYSFGVTATF